MPNSYPRFLQKLDATPQATMHFGTEAMAAAVDACGLRRPAEMIITVAGTNGKGSVASALHILCATAGLRTTLLTSPHLVDVRERIRLQGEAIPTEELRTITEPLIDRFGAESAHEPRPLSYFELTVLAGLQASASHATQVLIIEVGLGGRLDAANALDTDLAVFTSISRDHTELLGDTVEAIAREKAAVARAGKPALVHAHLNGSNELHRALEAIGAQTRTIGSQRRPREQNFELAIAAFECVEARFDTHLDTEQMRQALSQLHWPGRQSEERSPHGIQMFIDGAHNAESVAELRRVFTERREQRLWPAVVALSAGRDAEEVLIPMHDMVSTWHVCAPEFSRARPARETADALAAFEHSLALRGKEVRRVQLHGTVQEALDAAELEAYEWETGMLVFGSLYLAGETYAWIGYNAEVVPAFTHGTAPVPVEPEPVARTRTSLPNAPRPKLASAWAALLLAILGIVSMAVGGAILGTSLPFYALIVIGSVIGNVLPALAVYLSFRLPIELPRIHLGYVGWGIGLGVLLSLTGGALTGFVSELLSVVLAGTEWGIRWEEVLAAREETYDRLLGPTGAVAIISAYIAIALVPGLVEEFFFRGALFRMVQHLSDWRRILFIGTLFGVIHFDPAGVVPLVMFGIVLTWMRARSGSWGLPALVHIVFNATSLTLALVVAGSDVAGSAQGSALSEELATLPIAGALSAALLALSIFMLWHFSRALVPSRRAAAVLARR